MTRREKQAHQARVERRNALYKPMGRPPITYYRHGKPAWTQREKPVGTAKTLLATAGSAILAVLAGWVLLVLMLSV